MYWKILIALSLTSFANAEDPQHIKTVSCVRGLFGSASSSDPFVIKPAGMPTTIQGLKRDRMYALVSDDFNVKAIEIEPSGKVDYWLENKSALYESGVERRYYQSKVDVKSNTGKSPFFLLVDAPLNEWHGVEALEIKESNSKPKEKAAILSPTETQLLISEYLTNNPVPQTLDGELARRMELSFKTIDSKETYFKIEGPEAISLFKKSPAILTEKKYKWFQKRFRNKKLTATKIPASDLAITRIKSANMEIENRLRDIENCDQLPNKTVAKAAQQIKNDLIGLQNGLKDLTFNYAVKGKAPAAKSESTK